MPPPRKAEALSDAFVWRLSACLSRTSGVTREQRGPREATIGTEVAHVTRDSHTTFRSKGKRSTCCRCLKYPTCRNRCHLANKYEDIVHLQGAEAYCVAPRTACFRKQRCGKVWAFKSLKIFDNFRLCFLVRSQRSTAGSNSCCWVNASRVGSRRV